VAMVGDGVNDAPALAGHQHGHAGAAVVEVAPGRTGSLVYRFDQPGPVLIGCHEPGHYEAGMRGIVEVRAAASIP
ncbi:MAG: hypothetical protein QOE93_2189, partial [Actinomycetota bacterium]|nr:hypothetical protein [Actinomycetota bacterium]